MRKDITVGIGYAYNNTNAKSLGTDTDINGHTAFVYGKYQPAAWYVEGTAGYGFASYDEKKSVLGASISAKYDVQNIMANAYAGYEFANGWKPEIGVRYLFITQDQYKDSVDQRINTDDSYTLTTVVGVKYARDFKTADRTLTANYRLAATYDVMADKTQSSVTIGNSSYVIDGSRMERLGAEAGIGLNTGIGNWDLGLNYDLGIRKDFQSHTGTVKVKYNF